MKEDSPEQSVNLTAQDGPGEYQIVFELQLAERDRRMMTEHPGEVAAAYTSALKVLFGVPVTSRARLRANYGPAYRLDGVRGVIGREPTPDEVSGCLIGVTMALFSIFKFRHTVLDHAAAARLN